MGGIATTRRVLLVSMIVATSGCGKSPESTVESFYRAVGRGEITEAQGYVSSQVMGMMGQQKAAAVLAQEAERIQRCGGIKAIEVHLEGQGEIRSGTATVMYTGQCQPKRESVKLIREEGKWKLGATK